jgi:hypothetical protein
MNKKEREQQEEWEAQLYENLQTSFIHIGRDVTSLLIQGDSAKQKQQGLVLINGYNKPWLSSTPTSTATEIYDYMNDSFRKGPDMKVSRKNHASVTLLSGDVAVFGGNNHNMEPDELSSCEVFNAKSKVFSHVGNMTTERESPAAVLLRNGLVFIVGGLGKHTYLKSCEFYNSVDKTFTASKAKMSIGRLGPTASLLPNGKVLVCGGTDGHNYSLRTTEIYDPLTDSFSDGPLMTVARCAHTATSLLDGRVLLVGGAVRSLTAEIYDPTTNSFSSRYRMFVKRNSHFSVLLPDGRVLFGGGRTPETRKTTEIYDPKTNSFTWGPRLLYSREDASASLF